MKRFFSRSGIWLLFVAVVAVVTLCLVSFFSSNSSFLSNLVNTAASPFRSAFSAVASWVEDKQSYYEDSTALREENAALKKQLAEMEADVRQAQADSEENARLRRLLNLRQQRKDFEFESARVVEQSSSNWESSLTLNRGTDQGVAVNDCVVTDSGYLVGVVSEAGGSWCKVMTVVDTDMSMGALDFRTGEVCVAQGDFHLMPGGKLLAAYVDSNAKMMVGDLVVTSGLGGYYPSGLVIGTVTELKVDDSGLSLSATLTPKADLSQLTEVFIIKSFDIVD